MFLVYSKWRWRSRQTARLAALPSLLPVGWPDEQLALLTRPRRPMPDIEPADPGRDRQSPAQNAPAGERSPGIVRRAASAVRRAIRRNPRADRTYRASVGAIGGATTLLGIVLMPLPGPGALVALGGLGILATEFEAAGKVKDASVKIAKKVTTAAKKRRANRANGQ